MIRPCYLRKLPLHLAPHAPGLAVTENPQNAPYIPIGLDGMPVVQRDALVTGKRWQPGRTLRIAFHDGTTADRSEVLAAAQEWMRYANIVIEEADVDAAELRCSFDRTAGSWSLIGTDALALPPAPDGSVQATLNMGWPNDPGRDLHELGHALGLIHEHQNPLAHIPWNTNAVIAYYAGPPNYWPPQMTIENVLAPVDPSSLTNGGFDKQSVMLYPCPAELLLDPSFATGWNQVLSPFDKTFIASVYPRV